MGGINRASTGRNEFGVPGLAFPGFQKRSIGQDMSASNVWATATIHDFDAMDQAILNSPSPNDFANAGASRWNTNLNLPAVPRLAPAIQLDEVNLAGNWRTEPAATVPASNVAVGGGRPRCSASDPLRRGRQLFHQGPAGRGRRQAERGQDLLSNGRPALQRRLQATGAGPARRPQRPHDRRG